MNPLALLKLAWAFRKWIGIALAAIAVVWFCLHQLHAYGDRRAKAEGDRVTALWTADTAARDKADAAAAESNRKLEEDRRKSNAETEKSHAQELAAINADRDGLVRLLRGANGKVLALSANQATDQLGLAAAREIASRAEETYRLLGNYDAACRADSAQLNALIAEIKPQL